MYGNIPVVTDIPSIKEVLDGYGIGLWNRVKHVQDLTRSMVEVEKNISSLKEQGKKARQIVEENYTWQSTCDKYLKLADMF